MDTGSTFAIQLLETIARNHTLLRQLATQVKTAPEVANTRSGFHSWQYPDECVLEGFVSAELHNGTTVDWWLETHWNSGKWELHAEVFLIDDEGQDTILEFEDRTAASFDQLLPALDSFTRELIASAEQINLASIKNGA
jgi:hypothetical protein